MMMMMIMIFMLLSFHLQLPTHIMHERKLHFIAYESVRLFSTRSVYTRSFEHLNKIGVRATMDCIFPKVRVDISIQLNSYYKKSLLSSTTEETDMNLYMHFFKEKA